MRRWLRVGVRVLQAAKGLRGPGDVARFIRILSFSAAVPLILRLKLTTVEKLVRPLKIHPHPASPERVQRVREQVETALRICSARRACLRRGLTLYYFLNEAGFDVSLSFGVGTPEESLEGHCWLVRDGEPIFENRDPRPVFTVMYRFPEGPPEGAKSHLGPGLWNTN